MFRVAVYERTCHDRLGHARSIRTFSLRAIRRFANRCSSSVPSTRHVASLLKVSRNTALLADEQLLAEGFIAPRYRLKGRSL